MVSVASIDELVLNLLPGTVGNTLLHFGQQTKFTGPKDREPYLRAQSIDLDGRQRSGAVLSDKGED